MRKALTSRPANPPHQPLLAARDAVCLRTGAGAAASASASAGAGAGGGLGGERVGVRCCAVVESFLAADVRPGECLKPTRLSAFPPVCLLELSLTSETGHRGWGPSNLPPHALVCTFRAISHASLSSLFRHVSGDVVLVVNDQTVVTPTASVAPAAAFPLTAMVTSLLDTLTEQRNVMFLRPVGDTQARSSRHGAAEEAPLVLHLSAAQEEAIFGGEGGGVKHVAVAPSSLAPTAKPYRPAGAKPPAWTSPVFTTTNITFPPPQPSISTAPPASVPSLPRAPSAADLLASAFGDQRKDTYTGYGYRASADVKTQSNEGTYRGQWI